MRILNEREIKNQKSIKFESNPLIDQFIYENELSFRNHFNKIKQKTNSMEILGKRYLFFTLLYHY